MLQPNERAQAPRADASDLTWSWPGSISFAVLVACVYMLSAKMSLALLTPDGVAVFWPAAGVAAGALIAVGPAARWPVVAGTMVATIVANLLGDRNVASAIVFALCNAGEAVIAAALIERYFGSPFTLDRLRNVLGLLAAATIAAALSGIGGALGFAAFHGGSESLLTTWRNWFASDALGIVTIAPLVIGLAAATREPPGRNEMLEGLAALASLVIMSVIAIALPPDPWTTVVPIALLFPVLLWIAARCRPMFAAAAAFIVTLAIVWTTTIEVGHYGNPSLPMADRVLTARAGILAVALCAYVLAALFAERRQQGAALAESEARLQEALMAGAVTTFVWDVGTGFSQRSTNAAQILGFDPRQPFSSMSFLGRVHPDDRERFRMLVRGVSREQPAYTASFRFKHADGRELWLEEIATAEFGGWGQLVRLRGLTFDVTARKRFETQQSQLIAVLDHRIQSVLARIAVVAKDARRDNDSLDTYIQAFGRRIQSMADVHALLSRHHWAGVDLAELVRSQLAPYATDANATIGGPQVTLTVAAAQALAMTLHELATNAAKYGALSTPHGRVEISWSGSPAGGTNLSLVWCEIGGPAVAPSPDCRYGVGVIRELVPRELGGSVDLAFSSSGVFCKIELPLEPVRSPQSGALRLAPPEVEHVR
jgi:PAS domain S-box-containing protein